MFSDFPYFSCLVFLFLTVALTYIALTYIALTYITLTYLTVACGVSSLEVTDF